MCVNYHAASRIGTGGRFGLVFEVDIVEYLWLGSALYCSLSEPSTVIHYLRLRIIGNNPITDFKYSGFTLQIPVLNKFSSFGHSRSRKGKNIRESPGQSSDS